MLQAEDKEALIGLEVDKISTCRDLVSNECQIAGTREVSCKCVHGTHIAGPGQTSISSHQSVAKANQTSHCTARTQEGTEDVDWLCDPHLSY